MICFFSEESFFFLADLSNALELGYILHHFWCKFLNFQSYFQLWKSKYKIDTLEVQRQFFSSYSFGLWKVTALWRHFTRCQEIQFFRQFFWSNFQKCKKVHRFWLSPTFWQLPSSHQQLYATWKFRNVLKHLKATNHFYKWLSSAVCFKYISIYRYVGSLS